MSHPPSGPSPDSPPPGPSPKATTEPGMPTPQPSPLPNPSKPQTNAISLVGAEYQITAKVWGQPIAHAVRTSHGWHIQLRRKRVGARHVEHWCEVDTRTQAAQVLTVLAQKALGSPK